MAHAVNVQWLPQPEDHDYPAAESYLSLLFDEKTTAGIIARMMRTPLVQFKAKDLFRARRSRCSTRPTCTCGGTARR